MTFCKLDAKAWRDDGKEQWSDTYPGIITNHISETFPENYRYSGDGTETDEQAE